MGAEESGGNTMGWRERVQGKMFGIGEGDFGGLMET